MPRKIERKMNLFQATVIILGMVGLAAIIVGWFLGVVVYVAKWVVSL